MRLRDVVVVFVGATLAIGCCLVLARLYIQSRWQRILWGQRLPVRQRPRIIIEAIDTKPGAESAEPSAGLGAVAAMTELAVVLNASRAGALRRLTRPLDFMMAPTGADPPAVLWPPRGCTVVVGGPKFNQVTAQLLREFGCQPLTPVTNGSDREDTGRDEGAGGDDVPGRDDGAGQDDGVDEEDLLRRTGDLRKSSLTAAEGLGVATHNNDIFWFGRKYAANVVDDRDPQTGVASHRGHDYGVVLRLHSPAAPEHRVVVLFGSHTFGVKAAATWLANIRKRHVPRNVRRMMANNKNIGALVEVDVRHAVLDAPKLRDLVVLPPQMAPRSS